MLPGSGLKENIMLHQGITIKGYSGDFQLQGPPALLQLGMAAGFGGKNAQGFGMMQMIERVSGHD